MSTSTTTKSVILNTSADWDNWLYIIRSMATEDGVNVWEYMDPDLAKQPTLLSTPQAPKTTDIRADADDLDKLTQPELERFKLKHVLYKDEYAHWKLVHQAIQKVHNAILQSISANNIPFIRQTTTTWDLLSALKKRLAPTTRARELETLRRYSNLKTYDKNQNLETWLQSWEKCYIEATTLKLPDVEKHRPLFDFLEAIRNIDAHFAG